MKPQRQVFNVENKPVTLIQKEYFFRVLNDHAQTKKLRRKYIEPPFKINEILNQINYEWLKEKFVFMAEAAGVSLDPASLPNRSNIKYSEDKQLAPDNELVYAEHPAGSNFVTLLGTGLADKEQRFKIDKKLLILFAILHEYTHQISHFEYQGPLTNAEMVGYPLMSKLKSGVSVNKASKKSSAEPVVASTLFNAFDEGITEKIAREIFFQYLKEHPDFTSSESINQFKNKFFVNNGEERRYTTLVELVEAFIAKISEVAGVQNKVVWQALLKAKFEGIDFEDNELQQLFAEMVDDSFLDLLSAVNTNQEVKALINDLKLPADKIKQVFA